MRINIQSFIDIITNSSTTIYSQATDTALCAVKDILEQYLADAGMGPLNEYFKLKYTSNEWDVVYTSEDDLKTLINDDNRSQLEAIIDNLDDGAVPANKLLEVLSLAEIREIQSRDSNYNISVDIECLQPENASAVRIMENLLKLADGYIHTATYD